MDYKKTIIICDDDETDIKLFKKCIGAEILSHYNLIAVNDADELELLLKNDEQKIDFIFLDYYLGANSGLELLKKIRAANSVPVIMLTGQGDEEIAVECMKEGAMDYISKESLPEIDFVKIINQAIDKWQIELERNQLLGIAAHELRNPLTVILGYTEMLQLFNNIDNEEKRKIYEIIRTNSKHLLNIINELLDVTRIDKGIVSLKKKRIDLLPLVKKKILDYKLLAEKKKIKISFSTTLPKLEIQLDQDRIEEVLSNLIDNAIKYSPLESTVEISVILNGNNAEIKIEDSGAGIKESELKYLFELFSNKKISTRPTGNEFRTGIGLAISKKVIDAHNGKILVESKIGKGSVFTIQLSLDD